VVDVNSRRRALGQHFLVDGPVADRIVAAVAPTGADIVCEIGAGTGVLTERLAGRAGRVLALEVDPGLHDRLAGPAARWPAVELRLADARTFPYDTLPASRPSEAGRVLIVGNLPYSASKPILHRLWTGRAGLDQATLMLQREVAERLVAPAGGKAYGALSVLWQVWADVRLLFTVPPGAFRPPPAVESAVIQATFRSAPRVPLADPATFVRVVKAGFAQRRKTLANALRAGFPALGAEGIAARLTASGLDGRRRAETLSLDEFAQLSRIFVPSEPA
jgi:16S rRNA (adenine1518-N6/adenine1519-N6)-dimethyltransferase